MFGERDHFTWLNLIKMKYNNWNLFKHTLKNNKFETLLAKVGTRLLVVCFSSRDVNNFTPNQTYLV